MIRDHYDNSIELEDFVTEFFMAIIFIMMASKSSRDLLEKAMLANIPRSMWWFGAQKHPLYNIIAPGSAKIL